MDAFCQTRTWERAVRMGIAQLLCLGGHRVTNILCTCGRQNVDWSADYRLFSEDHWEARDLFASVQREVLRRLAPGTPLVLAMDDTLLHKSGRHVPGAGYRRDPLSPAFNCNLIWAQRFLQVSAALPQDGGAGAARCIPVAFEHAPSVVHPKKSDPPELWAAYRRQCRENNLSTRGRDLLKHLRQEMDRSAEGMSRPMVAVVDGSYTNQTMLRGLPDRTVLIGRVRKDLKLHALPPAGSGRRYGEVLPTPEALRQDDTVPWTTVQAYAAGQMREFRVKTMGPCLWKNFGPDHPLQVMVVAPVAYCLRKNGKRFYRQPAYLICVDAWMSSQPMLQYYLWRWDVEVNHRDEKQIIGVGEAQATNVLSAQRQPAFGVFSYSLLLLAAADAWGVDAIAGSLPPPKWRRGNSERLTTQQMVQELRKEVWAHALRQLTEAGSDFATGEDVDTKSLNLSADLGSALLYGSVA
jgi:hypothetical protein